MKFEKKIYFILYLLFIILVATPTFLLKDDTWDGILISYSVNTNNFEILKKLYFDSTWFLQYYYTYIIFLISKLFSLSYKNLNILVTCIIMLIYLREVYYFSKEKIKLNKLGTIIVISFSITFPIWSIFLSSVLSFHFFCLTLGILGIRLIHKNKILYTCIGFIFIIFTFNLKSLLVFLPILSYIYDQINRKIIKNNLPSLKTLTVLFFAIIYYIIINVYFPAKGLHEGYHQLFILRYDGILPVVLRLIQFITYLIPLSFAILIYHFFKLYIISKENNIRNDSINYIWGMLMLFFAGIFPYISVGIGSILWDVNDWNGRQALLIAFPTAIIISIIFENLYERTNDLKLKKIIIYLILSIIICNIVLLTIGVLAKNNRQHFFNELESVVNKNKDKIPNGIIQIVSKNLPDTTFEIYEPNYIMFKATGSKKYWTRIGNSIDTTFTIPNLILLDEVNARQVIFEKPDTNNLNHTILYIETQGFSGISNYLKNSFLNKHKSTIKLLKIENYKK